MNVFYLDQDPKLAAKWHCDKHVSKMIVESAQLLSTAIHVANSTLHRRYGLYKPTHLFHPCARWTRATRDNFQYVLDLGSALCEEFHDRFGNSHATQAILEIFYKKNLAAQISPGELTLPPLAMPEQYHNADPVHAYRIYYAAEKFKFAQWRAGIPPWWISYRQHVSTRFQ